MKRRIVPPDKRPIPTITRFKIREAIVKWAFLPLNEFTDKESITAKREYFGHESKIGVIVSVTEGLLSSIYDDEILSLDTVDDFVEFFESKNVSVRS